MKLDNTIEISANINDVWIGLNDPKLLKSCIPGCTSFIGSTETGFDATVTQKIGPVKATFKGSVSISDIVKNDSYKISGEGKGGAAGFAKGAARVKLKSIQSKTVLSYEVEAIVGGKIAQLGSRLIDGFAKNMAKKFFERFKAQVEIPVNQ
mgnify:CR=1 FL=1